MDKANGRRNAESQSSVKAEAPKAERSFSMTSALRQFYGLGPKAPKQAGAKPASSSGGAPLPEAVRSKMERVFRADFSSVRVHEGPEAEELGGTAFAQGEHLHFRPGAFKPDSAEGARLLGHELAHVMQQRAGRVRADADGKGGPLVSTDPALEAEADAAGEATARGETFALQGGAGRASGAVVQRQLRTYDDIQSNTTGFIWDPHRTQKNATGQTDDERTTFGLGTSVNGTTSMKVAWKSAPIVTTHGNTGEPSTIQANLHPRVKAGPAVGDWARVKTLEKAAKGKKKSGPSYVAAQMIPSGLGGGDQDENVVVIPQSAYALLEKKVYARLYALVGLQNACLRYNVTVTHDRDKTAKQHWAKTLQFEWHEVDDQGNAVAGTHAAVTLDVPSPTAYGGGTKSTFDRPATIGATGVANKALESSKTVKRAVGTAVAWQTEIDFAGTTADGDGVMMEARKLGPDHKMGEEPKKGIWKSRTKTMKTASGKAYVAGHLLNHQLGGPGNDARNLTPVPSDSNTKFEKKVESTIKSLVNRDHAWVYYKVEASFGHDATAGTDYPKAIRAQWHQLDEYGAAIAGTTGDQKISIDAPSAGGAYRVKNKQLDAHARVLYGAATTTVEFQNLLLDNDPTVLRTKITVMKPLVDSLLQLDLKGDFQRSDLTKSAEEIVASFTPQKAELDAYKTITDVTDELGKVAKPTDLKLQRYDDVLAAIQISSTERGIRNATTESAVKSFFEERYEDTRAQQLVSKYQTAAKLSDSNMRAFEILASGLAKHGKKLHEQVGEDEDLIFQQADNVRQWLGLPPLDRKVHTPMQAMKDLDDGTTKLVFNVHKVNNGPWSPGQYMTYGESEGLDKTNSEDMRMELSTQWSDKSTHKNKEPDLGKIPRQKLDEKLLAVLLDDTRRAKLISVGWSGPPNEVATAVLVLAQMIETTKTTTDPRLVAEHTITSLYRRLTGAFRKYWTSIDGIV